jgi:REP element-mobilizing transposase RayT
MPNRVHLLIDHSAGPVSRLTQSLKRFTATQGNQILGRTGQPFWQDESYDRLVRNDAEFRKIAHYAEMNPVNAGSPARRRIFQDPAPSRLAIGLQASSLPDNSAIGKM